MPYYPLTDDPHKDFDNHEAQREFWLRKRPRCSECGEHIQDEYAYYYADKWICEKCMKQYRQEVNAEF